MSKLAEVREELTMLRKAQVDAFAQYSDVGEMPDEVISEIEQRTAKAAELGVTLKRLEALAQDAAEAKAAYDHLAQPARGGMVFPGNSAAGDATPQARPQVRKSLGQRLLEDPEYAAWYKSIAPHGQISEKRQFNSPAINIDGGLKALITGASDTSGGAFVFNDVQAGLTPLGRRPLTIRDVVTNGTTNGDTVEFVRVTTETNNAAPVAEATDVSGGVGVKPQSNLAFEKVTTPVKTIAHWVAATTRALSDAGQLRTLIDEFLRYGLEEELEDQMVTGDGTGENFTGIANISGTQSQAWDTNILTTTREARTLVLTVGRANPTAYLLNPADWQTIDLLQDNEGRYYYGGPADMGRPRLWGLPVVESEAVPSGVGYVGAWRNCVLWDREQASIQVSNSHADFFIKNLVAVLAEMRAAFGCLKPNTIVEIDLTA